ncbi:MAG: DUF2332 domain-containing protein [Actinobacteria bacterium]|nr:DUF2332 domain-containing protein [Actinomycetota bacterium]
MSERPPRTRRWAGTARRARPAPSQDPIAALVQLQRRHIERSSPLYAAVLDAVLADVAAGGVCRALLEPHRGDPFGSALILRFLGAAHRLVLSGSAPDLAAHYPSAGGTPGAHLGTTFLATVSREAEAIAQGLHVPVQTNEPGRSAALLGGYLAVAGRRPRLPLRVLEVGASAGLNLRWDRFRYEAAPSAFGPAESPVRFVEPFAGPPPHLPASVEVESRRGCDPNPIDATTEQGEQLLRSFVWPDQTDRLLRLAAAIEVARSVPAIVDRANAATWVAEQLEERRPGVATVVVHSVVLQYLDEPERARLRNTIVDAGHRATADAPLAWLTMEPAGDHAEVHLTVWPARAGRRPGAGSGGEGRLLATSAYHGPPVRWVG